MSIVKEQLRMILEGSILNEADVISFAARSKQKQYEKEYDEVHIQLHKVTEEYKAIIAKLDLQKHAGHLTMHQYIEKVMEHQPQQRLMHDLNGRLHDIKTNLDKLSQGNY